MPKLHDAIIKGDFANVEQFLKPRWWRKTPNVNARDPKRGNETALQMASNLGHIKIVHLLIAKGAHINSGDPNGNTPLHATCIDGHYGVSPEIAAVLLDAGATVDPTVKSSGWTPLHYATNGAHPDLVRLLLAHGANVHARTNEDDTPLHTASYGEGRYQLRCDVGQILLDAGAAIDAREKQHGMTPLMYAADRGFTDLARLYLDHGADVNAEDNSGQTALEKASEKASTTDVLLRSPNRNEEAVRREYGSLNPYRDVVKLLHEYGATE